MSPLKLTPVDPSKLVLPSGKQVKILSACISFRPWRGVPVPDSYGGKAVVTVDGRPLFAELAILAILKRQGWDGVWGDSYRRKFRTAMPGIGDPVSLGADQQRIWERLCRKSTPFSGCWDIFAWRGRALRFIELKRKGRDRIRQSQLKWLEAALSVGIALRVFQLAEWHINDGA